MVCHYLAYCESGANFSLLPSIVKRANRPHLIEMNKAYKIPESVLVVIHTAQLDVLLMERAGHPGFWQSVTGSKDLDTEPLRLTAMREVAEETGIQIGESGAANASGAGAVSNVHVPSDNLQDWHFSTVFEIYLSWRQRYAPGITHNTEHVFSLLVPAGIAITLEPREHVRQVWLPYREAAEKCFSESNAAAILQLPQHVAEARQDKNICRR